MAPGIIDRARHKPARALTCAIGVTAFMAAIGLGQAPQQDGGSLLRGPDISDSAAKSLVNYDMAGRLVRIEGRPEEAAFELLAVDDARREQARHAIHQRSIDLGLFLVDHLDLLKQAADAQQAGDTQAVREITRRLFDECDAGTARDPLLEVLRPILSPDERGELSRLLDEYWDAWIERELGDAQDRGAEARQRIQQRLVFSLFEQELRRTYDWSIRPYRERLDLINAAVEPTDEQREAIRAIVISFIRETRLEPTPLQRLEGIKRIYLLLDEDRRTRLFELVASLQYGR